MATREERIRIAFEADLSDMRKELAKLPEISSKEAKKMVKALEKQYKRAERAAKKTAKAQKDSAGKVTAGFEAAKQAATGFGGAIGAVGGQVEAFARSIMAASTALGPVGLGLVVVTAGMAAFTYVTYKAVSALVALIADTEESLEALRPFQDAGLFEVISPHALESVRQFNDSLDGTSIVAKSLSADLGAYLAVELEDTSRLMLIASLAARDLIPALRGIVDTAGDMMTGGWLEPAVYGALRLQDVVAHSTLALLGLTEQFAELGEEADETARILRDEKDALKEEAKATAEAAEATKAAAAAKRNAADADRAREKALRDVIKAIHEQEAAQDSLTKITAAANDDLLTAEDKIRNAHEDRIDAILEVGMASKDTAAVTAAIAATDARQIRELEALDLERTERQKKQLQEVEDLKKMFNKEAEERARAAISNTLRVIDVVASSIGGTIDTLAGLRLDHIEETFNANAEAIEKEGAKRRRLEESTIAGLLEVGKIDQAEADSRLGRLDEQDKADQKKIKTLKKISEAAALKSFKTQKAIAKALAIIDGARAAVAMVPGFLFLTPPGAVAAAATLAAAATGAQLAVIGAQKPPDFPMGGLVADRLPGGTAADHVAISAQPSEGIVTGRGMDGLGRGGLDNINQGGGGGPMSISLTIGSTVIARAILETPDLIRQITAELQIELGMTSGRVPVYGRG